ncbi:uncharacterized protein LOC114844747 [Betta splendens]|uniref:Uncharacterized protein LOC114844747 n=1 Tax=Betta splendens TaxID=158456 RepID=A0A6P7L0M1_BETSP|nr:uncharacterized protein LOC114844747 [Betta splendens]
MLLNLMLSDTIPPIAVAVGRRGNVQKRGGTHILQIHQKLLQNFRSTAWGQLIKNQDGRNPHVPPDAVIMTDEAAVMEEDISPAESPLVTLTFRKDDKRKLKYLEAEPKALGITQIGLSLFNIICATVLLATEIFDLEHQIPILISSLLVMIAGSVAVAAQNLHLPTLKACLGMQIVACVGSFVSFICSIVNISLAGTFCPYYYYRHGPSICKQIMDSLMHFSAESIIVHVALFAISVTLSVYCCKVINCCTGAPRMPVITVQAPLSNSQGTDGQASAGKYVVAQKSAAENCN